jgi:hypothetical protein
MDFRGGTEGIGREVAIAESMTARIISFLWAIMPTRWAYRIWRWSVRSLDTGDLLPVQLVNSTTALPPVGRGILWGSGEAESFACYLDHVGDGASDERVEKVLRLVEIRKERFFSGTPCRPALILAAGFARFGERWNDLRFVNTALKLRDLAVTSHPPLLVRERAAFASVDEALNTLLKQISSR